MFMNEKLKNKLKLNTKHYSNLNFEESVEALDKFFFLISNKIKELNEENLLELAEGNYDKFEYWSFEKFLKAFCEIVKPDEYKQNEGSKNFFEKLYKGVFRLVPPEIGEKKAFSLGYAAKITIKKFDSYKYLSEDNPYICEFLYLYGFRNKNIVHDNEENTPAENGQALKCLCICVLYLCSIYKSTLDEKYSFERFRRELKSDWKEKCDSVYQEMIKKIGYVDFKWESKTRHTTSDIALQNSEELKNQSCFKFVGMAGSGKTTALLHINHLLLENYDNDNIFPVFFELKKLVGATGDFLPHMIEKCYDVSEYAAKSLMETDRLIFLLDGYDEIKETDIQKRFALEIEEYAKQYKSVRIIMTDRTEKNSISVLEDKFRFFRLCSIGKEDKKEYFEKNCKDDEMLKFLLDSLEDDNIVFRCLTTPLKLKHFMEVVSENKEIPDESVFMREHIKKLFDRERIEKKDINLDALEDYLKVISFLLGDEERAETTEIQVYTNESVGNQNYDIKKALKLAEDMGILKKITYTPEMEKFEKTSYEFSDDEYLEYYSDMLRENKILRKKLKKIQEDFED